MAWLILATSSLFAQEAPLITVVPVYDAPRSQTPLQLECRVRWDSPRTLEGHVHLEFFVGETLTSTWVSRQVVLAGGDLVLPLMTPAVILPSIEQELNIRASFVTEKRVYRNPLEINIQYWPDGKRVLVLGVIHRDRILSKPVGFSPQVAERTSWGMDLTIDRLIADRDVFSRHLSSRALHLGPDQLPDQPLQLMAFDVLLLTGDGLNVLTAPQLNAVAEWVEGGGAVCVDAQRVTTPEGQEFVRRMGDFGMNERRIQFTPSGEIRWLSETPLSWRMASPGVGRAMITSAPVDLDDRRFLAALANLWRLRASLQAEILREGTFSVGTQLGLDSSGIVHNPYYQPFAPESGLEHRLRLNNALSVKRSDALPFRTVAFLLGACLLAVGPVDYFVLSALRMRRWTWVVFPGVAIGFAVLTVILAQRHLSAHDLFRTITFIDLTREGQTARTTTLQMFFSASEKVLEEKWNREWAVPLEFRQQVRVDSSGHQIQLSRTSPLIEEVDTYVGRTPLLYSRLRPLRQWEGRLSKIVSLGPETRVPPWNIDWDQLSGDALQSRETRSSLLASIARSISQPAFVIAINRGELFTATNDSLNAQSRESTKLFEIGQLARQLSASKSAGLFHIVSQISPNGSGSLEDLILMEDEDDEVIWSEESSQSSGDQKLPNGKSGGDWLVMIVLQDQDENFTVYRRLLRGDEH